jgi:glutaredoxin
MTVTLLYFDGCPNWKVADERLAALAGEFGFDVVRRNVETPEQAEEAGFRGSPTILVNGRDPFARGDEPVGLACRVFQTPAGPAGVPSIEQLVEVLGA